MPRKSNNLKYELHQKINSLLRIGESKHQAKQDYKKYCQENNIKYNPSKTEGIHSIKTTEAYRQTVNEFSGWLKANHKEIRNINQIDKSVAYEYLKHRENSNCSAYTISKDMSAINKILDLGLNKKDGNLQQRSYKNITRSRDTRAHDSSYNAKNYQNQILLAKAFGVRRETVLGGTYQAKDVSLYKNGDNVFIRVIEKGGRFREIQCLGQYKDEISKVFNVQNGQPLTKQEFQDFYKSSNNYLFDKYTTKIDNHSFRAEYATLRYKELLEEKQRQGQEILKTYYNYDKELVLKVSQELGHNRPSVVVQHYLKNQ